MSEPINGVYENGPVEIEWNVEGDGYTRCKVTVLFNGDQVAQNTLHRDSVNWDTGKHAASDGWLDASFRMTIPTRDQEGALELVLLAWEQNHEGEQKVENIELKTWTPTGS
jgi:hypothetical protein